MAAKYQDQHRIIWYLCTIIILQYIPFVLLVCDGQCTIYLYFQACKCSYDGGFTCSGTPVACATPGRCNNIYIDGVFGLEYCLQGGGDCNGAGVQSYELGETTCDCNYHSNSIFSSGGCKISVPPPRGYACKCKYLGAWTCGGTMQLCSDVNSSFCKNPDSSKDTCNQGGGDCGGY